MTAPDPLSASIVTLTPSSSKKPSPCAATIGSSSVADGLGTATTMSPARAAVPETRARTVPAVQRDKISMISPPKWIMDYFDCQELISILSVCQPHAKSGLSREKKDAQNQRG